VCDCVAVQTKSPRESVLSESFNARGAEAEARRRAGRDRRLGGTRRDPCAGLDGEAGI